MTNFIPVFPLDIVVYPTEQLNLHIFEPRYKQLIKECIAEQKAFGIPVVIDKQVKEYGTSIEIVELVKEYDSGEMDIRAKGVDVFRVLEIVKSVPDRLYSGGIVSYPENDLTLDDTRTAQMILKEVERLFALLSLEEKMPKVHDADVLSYRIAHFLGMSTEQEYELMQLFKETQRLEYIRKYMSNMLPMLEGLEKAKAKIKMNGHFRGLSLDDIDLGE